MFVQASSIVAAQIYRADDAPRCKLPYTLNKPTALNIIPDRRGNRALISICVVNLVILYPGTRFYYKWRNAQKEKKWNGMTPEVRLAWPSP